MDVFKQAFPVEDSVIHGPKGRYFLPVFATGGGKELTRKKAILLTVVAVVAVALIVGVIGYFVSDGPQQFYEHTESMSTMMGQTPQWIYETFTAYGSGLVDTGPNQCAIPGGAEFAGVAFEVLLGFDKNTQGLNSVAYLTTTKASPTRAAQILDNILGQFIYESVILPDGGELKIDRGEIRKALENPESFALNVTENITPNQTFDHGVSRYLTELEASDDWEGRIGEYLVRRAMYYRDIEVRYEPKTQNLYISIRQTVEADRDK